MKTTSKPSRPIWGSAFWAMFALLYLVQASGTGATTVQTPGITTDFLIKHVHALSIDSSGKSLWMGTHTGLIRSGDRGKTWTPVPLPLRHDKPDIMSLVADVNKPGTIYMGTHDAGVFKTDDDGSTWIQSNHGLGGTDIHGLAADPNHPGKLYAAVRDGAAGIYRSLDGGKNWVRVADGPPGETLTLVSVNLSTGMGGIFLYAGTSEGLFRSPDCF